jgi:hypothetical protein
MAMRYILKVLAIEDKDGTIALPVLHFLMIANDCNTIFKPHHNYNNCARLVCSTTLLPSLLSHPNRMSELALFLRG